MKDSSSFTIRKSINIAETKDTFCCGCLIRAIWRLKFTLHLIRRLFSICERELEDLRMWSRMGPLAHARSIPLPHDIINF